MSTHPLTALTLAGLTLLAPLAAHAQAPRSDFAPNETQAAPRKDLLDLEFSPSRSMFTWCDKNGQLWVGTLDPATGNILKPTYKLLDTDAITPQEMGITTNGPEWVSTATGDHVVYTKFVADPAKPSAARLALVEGSADGTTWGTPIMLGPNAGRNAPYASDDDGDTQPRISYVDAKNNHYWRYLYDVASEAPVLGMARTPKPVSVRFTKGNNGLVYSQDVNGTNQVFMEQLDTGKLTQITSDDGAKDVRTVPWMWRAPEYNNKLVLLSTVNENELRFYKGDGSGKWAVINSILLPTGSTVASPEPFVYLGRSYVVLAVKAAPYTYPTAIYIAAVSPTATTKLWKVSDDADGHERIDPEVFITTQNGVVVFYNKFNPAMDPTGEQPTCAACSEGLFRATTGL
ncbi:MAG TPA: hypothetical protein VLA61_16590 [Ideonella sp.]|uniref:hypothetical protein n=1 Tax=Ideonella sp. TaxID=1929293 RepID=UPI002CA32C55|nr:hypothetical protein [Ideonella sp.]HSI49892.1 hypothetical protein [Ideonella sp.]